MTEKHRSIRSFVRREGRLTPGQQRALDLLWPEYGIEMSQTSLDLAAIFGRTAPITLEIGFGNGASLAQMADLSPERDFLAIEVHRPGIGRLLQFIDEKKLENIRVIDGDAMDLLRQMIPHGSIDRVQLFFPDPWPKKRHHKRRLVNASFLQLVSSALAKDGVFHLATDWEDYALQMLEVLDASDCFHNTDGAGNFSARPDYRPLTKFEQRGLNKGHGVWDLIYANKSA